MTVQPAVDRLDTLTALITMGNQQRQGVILTTGNPRMIPLHFIISELRFFNNSIAVALRLNGHILDLVIKHDGVQRVAHHGKIPGFLESLLLQQLQVVPYADEPIFGPFAAQIQQRRQNKHVDPERREHPRVLPDELHQFLHLVSIERFAVLHRTDCHISLVILVLAFECLVDSFNRLHKPFFHFLCQIHILPLLSLIIFCNQYCSATAGARNNSHS